MFQRSVQEREYFTGNEMRMTKTNTCIFFYIMRMTGTFMRYWKKKTTTKEQISLINGKDTYTLRDEHLGKRLFLLCKGSHINKAQCQVKLTLFIKGKLFSGLRSQ